MRNTGSILNWKQKYSSILPRQKYFYYMYFSIAHLWCRTGKHPLFVDSATWTVSSQDQEEWNKKRHSYAAFNVPE